MFSSIPHPRRSPGVGSQQLAWQPSDVLMTWQAAEFTLVWRSVVAPAVRRDRRIYGCTQLALSAANCWNFHHRCSRGKLSCSAQKPFLTFMGRNGTLGVPHRTIWYWKSLLKEFFGWIFASFSCWHNVKLYFLLSNSGPLCEISNRKCRFSIHACASGTPLNQPQPSPANVSTSNPT